jgi:hypothetical protein
MILVLTTTSTLAATIRLSASFSLGSLIADGRAFGLTRTDVTIELNATGIPKVTCTNPAGLRAPGQNPPKVSAKGTTFINSTSITKNGSAPYVVETGEPDTSGMSAKKLGCPSNNWTPTVGFVYWTAATLTVYRTDGHVELLKQNYACTTTPTTVSCTLIS